MFLHFELTCLLSAECGLGATAPALLRLLSADLQILNLQLDRLPPDPSLESTVSTAPPLESQDGRDAWYRFSCPDC